MRKARSNPFQYCYSLALYFVNQINLWIIMQANTDQDTILCVARTPLQLFNIIEACERFHLPCSQKYLVLVAGSLIDLKMMQSMIQSSQGWREIKVVIFYGWLKKLYAWQLNTWLQQIKPISHLYMGMITHVPLHILNKIQPKKLVLVDDGNETFLISRAIVNIKNNNVKQWVPNILTKLFGVDLNQQALLKAEFFTLFDITNTGISYIVNDYRCFKNKSKLLEQRHDILVIGSNLIGNYLTNIDVLVRRLLQLKRKLPLDTPLWYAPHRYEKPEHVERIAANGFKIYRYKSILEYAQIQQGWLFAETFSIRSTAVNTLFAIYGTKGTLCRLPTTDFVSLNKWEECEKVWSNHISVLNLA